MDKPDFGHLNDIPVNGPRIDATATVNCVIMTVAELVDGGPAHPGDVDIKEHQSFVDALNYLKRQADMVCGNWKRVHIINIEEVLGHGV